MTRFRLWMIAVLTLMFSLIVAVPNEAMAGKSFGITKKEYIKAYNKQLSRLLGLRFEKLKTNDIYKLSNDAAYINLKLGTSEQIEEITLVILLVEGRPEDEWKVVMGTGVTIAVEPNPTTNTINLFTKKFRNKMDQGLNEFSFEMGDKRIDVSIKKPGGFFVTIKPL